MYFRWHSRCQKKFYSSWTRRVKATHFNLQQNGKRTAKKLSVPSKAWKLWETYGAYLKHIFYCILKIKFPLQVISVEQYTKKQWELTAEGKSVAANGSHEAVVYNAVPNEGIPQPELMVTLHTNYFLHYLPPLFLEKSP